MSTQEKNTITIEVLNPIFDDACKPFFPGDWVKAKKVSKIEKYGRYYIQEKKSKSGTFMVLNHNVEIGRKCNVYELISVSRFL